MSFDIPRDEQADKEEYERWEREQQDARKNDPGFDLWWASDVHGWGTEEHGAEYTLARDAWNAACAYMMTPPKQQS